jgi:tRNA A-37 threonylcarbamoyl transferase component Bud32
MRSRLEPGDLKRIEECASPFALALQSERTGEATDFACDEVLRVLQGRRVVLRAATAAAPVVLKLFLGPDRGRYRDREQRGIEWMAGAGVPVPEVVDRVVGEGIDGLVLEYLSEARPVGPRDQTRLEQVAELLGRMHEAGLVQADLHLDNFLATERGVYAVDGDGIRRRRGRLSLGAGLDNLAVLAAQRPPAEDGGSAGLLAAYLTARKVARAEGGLEARLKKARRLRLERYARKTLRDCTEYRVERSWRCRTFAVRGVGERVLAALDGRPEQAFESGAVLKSGNSATVVRVDGAEPVVVKRFNIKSPGHALRRMLRPMPRFRRAWMAGQLLHFLDIPTARPLALVEHRLGPLRGVAYLVMRDIGGRNLREEIAEIGLGDERCAEIAELFRLLRVAGLTHNDTKATNFLVRDGEVCLIDLDAMRIDPSGSSRDVRRFLENFSAEERRRFRAGFEKAGLL